MSASILDPRMIDPSKPLIVGNISATGTMVLDTSSSNAALRVTQKGTGNVIEFEDDANPDSTLFKITSAGNVIIGTASLSALTPGNAVCNLITGQRGMNVFRYGPNNAAGALYNYKTRGNNESEHVILSAGDYVGVWSNLASNGLNNYVEIGRIHVRMNPSLTCEVSSMPSLMEFFTTSAGTTSQQVRMLIDSSGNVGIGTTTPNELLTVAGNISATGSVYTSSITGITSAAFINIGSLSARTFDLIHSPANDGVDPVFSIGETGTAGFSGFSVRYEEPSNRLILSSRTGSTVLTSAIINVITGQVGISGLPASGQALTVRGNLSASRVVTSAGDSDLWNAAFSLVRANSASWEETADILPTVTSYLSTQNVTISSITGTTSAAFINIGSLSARTFDLIHSPANDGVDPVFNIGETATAGFSGLRIRYEEPSNRLVMSSRTGSTILTSAIIDIITGNVGIGSTLPASGQTLTVAGNISATGTIYSSNTLTTTICAISGNGSTPFSMQFTNGLLTSINF